MANAKEYLISETGNNSLDKTTLATSISEAITNTLIDIQTTTVDGFVVIFENDLDAADDVVLDTLIAAHSGSLSIKYKAIIEASIAYFGEILIDISVENVLLGITQLGMTKDVSDYLADVIRYGQAGSLTEVIHEIDRLVAAGVPENLSPFVTEDKLSEMQVTLYIFLTGV